MSAVSMGAVAPPRSFEQRMSALATANHVRVYRARVVKPELRAGRRSVSSLLFDFEDEVETMRVIDVLVSLPKVGRVKANRWLTRARISPSKTIGGLTERQRRELLVVMG